MEKWSVGKHQSCIVTDTPDGLPENSGHSGAEAIEYYGGALVCESVCRKKDAALISAAPDMLEALQIILGDIERAPKKLTQKEKIQIARKAIQKATQF